MKQADYNVQAFAGPAQNKQPFTPQKRDVVVIIASGPSLTREDVRMVEQANVDIIGINNAYQITDKLNILYACDTKWWQYHSAHVPDVAKYSLKKDKNDPGLTGVQQMERGERRGLSRKWPVLNTGGNSGYQAVNLAYLLGYKTVILLGYDMQNTGGESHWHGDHKFGGSTNPVNGTFNNWKRDFETLAQKVQRATDMTVINATRKTALQCFPQNTLEEALCDLHLR